MSLHKAGTLVMDEEQKSDKKAQVWAKLVPVSQGLTTAEIFVDSFIIGRNPECTLQIHEKRLSGKHCEIIKFENKVTITDLSTNGTYLGDKKIGKNKT
jgi:pSer/pThr/pTyr-binding forkhead associated (FHA) protein